MRPPPFAFHERLDHGERADPQAAVDDWNRAHQVGIEVEYRLDDGAVKQTRTRSEAWVLSGHTAVIMLDGVAGCYALHRVTAI